MTTAARLDLHVHSRHSPDSWMGVQSIVEQLDGLGLRGFALTDHNTLAGHSELGELQSRYPQYTLVPGVEVSTEEGHLLAYGVRELPPVGRPIDETVEWVRGHGGATVLAHPFRWSHGVGRRTAEQVVVDGIETVNGHSSKVANARALAVAARRHLGTTGGSDAHDTPGIGRAVTEFPEDVSNLDEFLTQLRAGRGVAAGLPLTFAARVRLSVRTSALRLARGLRPI